MKFYLLLTLLFLFANLTKAQEIWTQAHTINEGESIELPTVLNPKLRNLPKPKIVIKKPKTKFYSLGLGLYSKDNTSRVKDINIESNKNNSLSANLGFLYKAKNYNWQTRFHYYTEVEKSGLPYEASLRQFVDFKNYQKYSLIPSLFISLEKTNYFYAQSLTQGNVSEDKDAFVGLAANLNMGSYQDPFHFRFGFAPSAYHSTNQNDKVSGKMLYFINAQTPLWSSIDIALNYEFIQNGKLDSSLFHLYLLYSF